MTVQRMDNVGFVGDDLKAATEFTMGSPWSWPNIPRTWL